MFLIRKIYKKYKEQKAAVALMTILYLTFCGLPCVLTLWAIGYTSGAYNALYDISQTTAYAAASVTSQNGSEISFNCGAEDDLELSGVCSAGDTYDTAVNSATTATNEGMPGRFGLQYDENMYFTNENREKADVIYAYSISQQRPGQAEGSYKQDPNNLKCLEIPTDVPGGIKPKAKRNCWTLKDAVNNITNFEPGVAVYMAADLKLGEIISVQAYAATAATISQPESSSFIK